MDTRKIGRSNFAKMKKITVPITQQVPILRLQDLLCNAFEGGSNYWYQIQSSQEPTSYVHRADSQKLYPHLDYPVNPGGSLTITTLERDKIKGKKEWQLNLESVLAGAQVMAEKYPRHFRNMMEENDDAETGDVFLQCCLFGELIYG